MSRTIASSSFYFILINFLFSPALVGCPAPKPSRFILWGPGLKQDIVLPVRYIFVQAVDEYGNNMTESLEHNLSMKFTQDQTYHTRIYHEIANMHDGSYLICYRMHQSYRDMVIEIVYEGEHVGNSPISFKGWTYHEDCYCPLSLDKWLETMNCKDSHPQMEENLKPFKSINATESLEEILKRYKHPGQFSVIRYIIRDNKVFRKTFGQHVDFKIFSDSVLLSLTRKIAFPDMEFLINLGDYALAQGRYMRATALFSWSGEQGTYDLVLPTYDLMSNTIKSLCSVDVLRTRGPRLPDWSDRVGKGFFRGRDSSRERLKLYFMSLKHPDMIDANITNMFFFLDWKNITTTPAIPMHEFFKFKYVINMDGTVAPYRTPNLLASGSLMLKQESRFYEHFYSLMKPYVHYVPFKADLSDLLEKIEWARANDNRAREIAANARNFVLENLLPEHLFCYHAVFLKKYSKLLVSKVEVSDDMEEVPQKVDDECTCTRAAKREEL